ncbi:MAG: hypothetical protein DRG24_06040 [Epsilonproteobacteria bacterium]|nr:MAG: hypothetical protein DRG24_06040 [Campylobacterota bacterium]
MKNILSQNEVDELLSVFQTETDNTEQLHELTLTKNDVRALQLMHESLGQDLSDKLSILFHNSVEITLLQIIKHPASAMKTLDELSSVSNCFEFGNEIGRYTLDISLAYSMIERLLGGSGISSYSSQELTEIEKRIYKKVHDVMLECIRIRWKHHKLSLAMIDKACEDYKDIELKSDVITMRMQITLDPGMKGQMQLHYPLDSLLEEMINT